MNGPSDKNDETFSTYFDEMVYTLSRVDDPGLIREFLDCILTPAEVQEIAARWALVRQIDQGVSQRTISRDFGLSLCKITRGSKELKKENSAFARMIEVFKNSKTNGF